MFWQNSWQRLKSWLVPDSHSGRILCIILLGVLLTQLAGYWAWRHQVEQRQLQVVDKVSTNIAFSVASTTKFFTSLPRQYRHMVLDQLRKMGGTRFYVSLNDERILIDEVADDAEKLLVKQNFAKVLQEELKYEQLFIQFSDPHTLHVHTNDTLLTEIPKRWSQRLLIEDLSPPILVIQIALGDNEWLYVATLLPLPDFLANTEILRIETMAYLVIFVIGILGLASIVIRQQTRPLTLFQQAAEEFGQDIRHTPLPVTGSREMRATASVFNQMQSRIQTYLTDRERFFAAMSHDLKTPITRMRLRTELLDDDRHRHKFNQDLNEVETMVKGALRALQDTHDQEIPERCQLKDLMAGIVDDLPDGSSVIISGDAEAVMIKPALMRRAMMNLVQNALFYGRCADIQLVDEQDCVRILIRDQGPGIPEEQLQAVFDPFVRLEPSRNRNTGGTGLGLGIARSIVHSHGGTLALENYPQGGLKVEVCLPKSSFDQPLET